MLSSSRTTCAPTRVRGVRTPPTPLTSMHRHRDGLSSTAAEIAGAKRQADRACIMDTGVLVAIMDPKDEAHDVCVQLQLDFEGLGITEIIPSSCVPEAEAVMIARRGKGFAQKAAKVSSAYVTKYKVADYDDVKGRVEEVVDQYPGIGVADAHVVATVEQYNTSLVASLDRRHMLRVVPKHAKYLTVLPLDVGAM